MTSNKLLSQSSIALIEVGWSKHNISRMGIRIYRSFSNEEAAGCSRQEMNDMTDTSGLGVDVDFRIDIKIAERREKWKKLTVIYR